MERILENRIMWEGGADGPLVLEKMTIIFYSPAGTRTRLILIQIKHGKQQ